MKSIEEIKYELAEQYSWSKWEYVPDDIKLKLMDEVCQEYAKQVAEAQRYACAENAHIKQESEYIDSLTGYAVVSRVDKDSILNTPLVTDNI